MSHRDSIYFGSFKDLMLLEYSRHYPKNGDSWKDCNPEYLLKLLKDSISKHGFEELTENHSHFIDIANFALFCYFRFQEVYSKR